MRKLKIILLFGVIFSTLGCSFSSKEEQLKDKLYNLKPNGNQILIDLNQIKTARDLYDFYCAKEQKREVSKILLPYNFETKKLDGNAPTKIAVQGNFPRFYSIGYPNYYEGFTLIAFENKITDGDYNILTTNMIESKVKQFLHKNKSAKQDVKIQIDDEAPIQNLNQILGILTDSYLKFLLQKHSNYLNFDDLIQDYPLNMMIIHHVSPPSPDYFKYKDSKMEVSIPPEEMIEGDIEINTMLLYGK